MLSPCLFSWEISAKQMQSAGVVLWHALSDGIALFYRIWKGKYATAMWIRLFELCGIGVNNKSSSMWDLVQTQNSPASCRPNTIPRSKGRQALPNKDRINEIMGSLAEEISLCFRIPQSFIPQEALVLTAYCDETGQEQNDWMFVSGFYGNADAWKNVAQAWPQAIGPNRKNLHMANLRFKRESERKMLERAASVPDACGLVPMVGGVRTGDYLDLLQGTPDQKHVNGYVVCIWAMLFDTLRGLPDDERLELGSIDI